MMYKIWFIIINGNQYGPLSDADIQAMKSQNQINDGTLAWKQGMPTWEPIGKLGMFNFDQPPIAQSPVFTAQPSLFNNNRLIIIALIGVIIILSAIVMYFAFGNHLMPNKNQTQVDKLQNKTSNDKIVKNTKRESTKSESQSSTDFCNSTCQDQFEGTDFARNGCDCEKVIEISVKDCKNQNNDSQDCVNGYITSYLFMFAESGEENDEAQSEETFVWETEALEKTVLQNIRKEGLNCNEIHLIKESNNKYIGYVSCSYFEKHDLEVTVDGHKFLWKILP